MNVAVPKESRAGERRVAATPESVIRLKKLGFDVLVESQAGAGASFNDDDYAERGGDDCRRRARSCGARPTSC